MAHRQTANPTFEQLNRAVTLDEIDERIKCARRWFFRRALRIVRLGDPSSVNPNFWSHFVEAFLRRDRHFVRHRIEVDPLAEAYHGAWTWDDDEHRVVLLPDVPPNIAPDIAFHTGDEGTRAYAYQCVAARLVGFGYVFEGQSTKANIAPVIAHRTDKGAREWLDSNEASTRAHRVARMAHIIFGVRPDGVLVDVASTGKATDDRFARRLIRTAPVEQVNADEPLWCEASLIQKMRRPKAIKEHIDALNKAHGRPSKMKRIAAEGFADVVAALDRKRIDEHKHPRNESACDACPFVAICHGTRADHFARIDFRHDEIAPPTD